MLFIRDRVWVGGRELQYATITLVWADCCTVRHVVISFGIFLPSSLWTLDSIQNTVLLITRVSTQATEFLTGVFHSFSNLVFLCNTTALHFAMVWIFLCAHTRDLNWPMSIPIYYYFISYFWNIYTQNHWNWTLLANMCLRMLETYTKGSKTYCFGLWTCFLLFALIYLSAILYLSHPLCV